MRCYLRRLIGAGLAASAGCLLLAWIVPATASPARLAAGLASAYGPQVTLPFTGLVHPSGVAVSASGSVYVTNNLSSLVMELPDGYGPPVTLPFQGVQLPTEIAVDGHGDVYVVDTYRNQVEELPATASGYGQQVTLPFTTAVWGGVTVDAHGNVYASAGSQVLELPATASGWGPQVTLPFSGLSSAQGVAVDAHGNVYVDNSGDDQVVELPAGATSASQQVTLPFNGLFNSAQIAVDAAGDVYVADAGAHQVVELLAGTGGYEGQVVLPFTGLSDPHGVAVDAFGNVFAADTSNERVLELPADAVSVVQPTSQTSTAGQSVSLQIQASSRLGATMTYVGGGFPAGLSINSTTGQITGRPDMVAAPVTTQASVTVNDADGASATVTFNWTVTPVIGRIRGYKSQCVTDSGYANAPGTKVVIDPCGSLLRERWAIGPHKSLVIRNMCLTDPHWGRWGTRLVLERCTGFSDQQWTHHANGEYTVAVHGLCLTDPRWSTRAGTQLIIRSCRDWKNQRWTRP